MDIDAWLKSLNLEEYINSFKNEAIDIDILSELTENDLKELGVKKIGHRKLLLKAISNLNHKISQKSERVTEIVSSENENLNNLIKSFPFVISSPLKEYISENNAGMKLWHACDTIELLIRFFVILGLIDFKEKKIINDLLLKQFWGKIEMPTLGAWMAMAKSLANHKTKSDLLFPEIHAYVNGSLSDLMYGNEKLQTPDTSFLSLRNRLAHGGGLNNKEANRLLNCWEKKIESCLTEIDWINEIKVVGIKSGLPVELKDNPSSTNSINEAFKENKIKISTNAVYILRKNRILNLWPLLLFGHPKISSKIQNENQNNEDILQIYVRKSVVRLQFTPIDVEGFSQTELGEDALKEFQNLFRLDAKKNDKDKKFLIQDFTKEIYRDASEVIGRQDDQIKIKQCLKSVNEGLIWLTGAAGIGKSFLAAKLMYDLEDEFKNSNTLVLSYRFKVGDNTRCNREAFVNFIIERLKVNNFITDTKTINEKVIAIDRLKFYLEKLNINKKLIIIIDGLDEIDTRDKDFANDFPGTLKYSGLIWICFGRPKPSLQELFKLKKALIPFPNGLPPMSSKDIRGMILEKIGPLKKKLLSNDKQNEDNVFNPFVDLVVKQAKGFPLYVKYVIGDILSNHYRVLDGNEILPKSLHAYHEKLIDGLGIGDLKFILTPLVATLAVSYEPLSLKEIHCMLVFRKIVSNDDNGIKLIENGLSAIASMIRQAPDPEGEEGYTLFHYSLREHILNSFEMTTNVKLAKDAFCELSMKPDDTPQLTNYLFRSGIDHFIDSRKFKIAGNALLNLYWLHSLFNLGKTPSDINGYWLKLPITSQQIDASYLNLFKPEALINNLGHFGDGKDWSSYVYETYEKHEVSKTNEDLNDFWMLQIQKKEINEKKLSDDSVQSKENNTDVAIDDIDDLFDQLISDDEKKTFTSKATKSLENNDFKTYFKEIAEEFEYIDEIKETEAKLTFYYQLTDFFLIAKLCHVGAEISQKICRLLLNKLKPNDDEVIMAHARLSAFYSLYNGQNLDVEINEEHLFYNQKIGTYYYKNSQAIDPTHLNFSHIIFRHCLKLIYQKYGLNNSFLQKLISYPSMLLPNLGNLNIICNKLNLKNISDLLLEISKIKVEEKGQNHPSSLEVNLSLANRLYFEMKQKEANLILENIYNKMLSLFGINDMRTIKALELKGHVNFELGDFSKAKVNFEKLLNETNKNFTTSFQLNEWRSRLAIIELINKNYDIVEELCMQGLTLFNNEKSSSFFSLYDDRVFVLLKNIIDEIKDGLFIPELSEDKTEKELQNITDFYSNKGLHEICLFYFHKNKNTSNDKIKDIYKFIRIMRSPHTFNDQFNFLLSKMNARHERCIRMRYCLGMNSSHSLKELAVQFGVDKNNIKEYILEGFKNIKLI